MVRSNARCLISGTWLAILIILPGGNPVSASPWSLRSETYQLDVVCVIVALPCSSRYYEPYRKRIAEQFRTQQAAWQASKAAAAGGEQRLVQEAGQAASALAALPADVVVAAKGQSAAQSVAAAAERQGADMKGAARDGRAQRMSTADRAGRQAGDTEAAADAFQQAGSVLTRQSAVAAEPQASVSAVQQGGLDRVLERGAQVVQRGVEATATSDGVGSVPHTAALSQFNAAGAEKGATVQQTTAEEPSRIARIRESGMSAVRLGEST